MNDWLVGCLLAFPLFCCSTTPSPIHNHYKRSLNTFFVYWVFHFFTPWPTSLILYWQLLISTTRVGQTDTPRSYFSFWQSVLFCGDVWYIHVSPSLAGALFLPLTSTSAWPEESWGGEEFTKPTRWPTVNVVAVACASSGRRTTTKNPRAIFCANFLGGMGQVFSPPCCQAMDACWKVNKRQFIFSFWQRRRSREEGDFSSGPPLDGNMGTSWALTLKALWKSTWLAFVGRNRLIRSKLSLDSRLSSRSGGKWKSNDADIVAFVDPFLLHILLISSAHFAA